MGSTTSPVTVEDLGAWLAEHGIDIKLTREVSFVPEGVGVGAGKYAVQLKVRRFVLDANGNKFIDEERRQRGEGQFAAEEVIWVPLHHLPGATQRVA